MVCNILDVARKAGVSHTTVSRVLRNAEGFSYAAATRDKVLQAARTLGYAPNPAAQLMRLKKTRQIGITTQAQNAYATYRLIEKCAVRIREHGYVPLMVDLSTHGGLLNLRHLEGALCMYEKHEGELTERLARLGRKVPLVTLRRKATSHASVRMVTTDSADGVTKALRHFQDLGHRGIGYVGYRSSGPGRHAYFQTACEALGLEHYTVEAEVHEENDAFRNGMEAAARFAANPQVSAVLCEDDEFALGILSGFSDLGLRVPRDRSVVGFDDLPFGSAVRPRLTTVGVKADERANRAVRLLIALIEGSEIQRDLLPDSILLEAELILRDSTAPPPRIT